MLKRKLERSAIVAIFDHLVAEQPSLFLSDALSTLCKATWSLFHCLLWAVCIDQPKYSTHSKKTFYVMSVFAFIFFMWLNLLHCALPVMFTLIIAPFLRILNGIRTGNSFSLPTFSLSEGFNSPIKRVSLILHCKSDFPVARISHTRLSRFRFGRPCNLYRSQLKMWDILPTGKSDLQCKIKETLLISELKPPLNENVGSEKLFLY